MWQTADGPRQLAGNEAHLIRETVGELVDAIRAAKDVDSNVDFGIPLWDQLTWQQQMLMLSKVSEALLGSSDPPRSTALLDATVAAIYAQMQAGVECEIDLEQMSAEGEEGDTLRRQEIVQALQERCPDGDWPDPECVVKETWELAIAEIQGWVLADEDWNLTDLALDMPPDTGRQIKQLMGIRDDYFTDIPPDATDAQARSTWADILELINGQRPDEAVFD